MILLSMKDLLERFSDCDTFSMTSRVFKDYNWLTKEELLEAKENSKLHTKEQLRKYYNENKDRFNIKIDFEKIYTDIVDECNEISAEGSKRFLSLYTTGDIVNESKYGKDNPEFYSKFYRWISSDIIDVVDENKFCRKEKFDHMVDIPDELKNNFIKYVISFNNEVTISSNPMINYYFKLNEETKEYLLKFKNDFELIMEDFAMYKNGVNQYYSCTHEEFNSIEVNYKTMSQQELNEYLERRVDSEDSIKVINEIIKMDLGTKFSFGSFGINDIEVVDDIYWICYGLKLYLKVIDEEKFIFVKVDEI